MAIKKYTVIVSRTYKFKADDEATDEYIKLGVLSMFNSELQFGLITANRDDFNLELLKEDD